MEGRIGYTFAILKLAVPMGLVSCEGGGGGTALAVIPRDMMGAL